MKSTNSLLLPPGAKANLDYSNHPMKDVMDVSITFPSFGIMGRNTHFTEIVSSVDYSE